LSTATASKVRQLPLTPRRPAQQHWQIAEFSRKGAGLP
jgi:hypothetical protein